MARTKQTARNITSAASAEPARKVARVMPVEQESAEESQPEGYDYDYLFEEEDGDTPRWNLQDEVALCDRLEQRARGAVKSINDVRLGLWQLPRMRSDVTIDLQDLEPDFDAVQAAAHRARRNAGFSQSRPLFLSEIEAAALKLGALDVYQPLLASARHGAKVETMDYRRCGCFILEKVADDFILHPRANEYGYAPPSSSSTSPRTTMMATDDASRS
jgi:hypothetical protein